MYCLENTKSLKLPPCDEHQNWTLFIVAQTNAKRETLPLRNAAQKDNSPIPERYPQVPATSVTTSQHPWAHIKQSELAAAPRAEILASLKPRRKALSSWYWLQSKVLNNRLPCAQSSSEGLCSHYESAWCSPGRRKPDVCADCPAGVWAARGGRAISPGKHCCYLSWGISRVN